jgi:DNA uptake protein ComE-like DNA-binding protein
MKTKLIAIPMIAAGLAATIALSGCGSSTTSNSSTAPTTSATTSASAGATATSSGQKVSANTASQSEISAALQAAGVANAQRWAKEVVEYRPYDTGDANLTKLQQSLAKYSPGQDTINKIVGALQP